MKSFKNNHTKTGKFYVNGAQISFNGVLETDDKDIINQLSAAGNWTEVKEETKKLSKSELKKAFKEAEKIESEGKAEEAK